MRSIRETIRSASLVAACFLAGCQAPGPQVTVDAEPKPVGGIGYVVFNAPINPSSRDLLIADIEKLRQAGATEIRIGMNSPGGEIDAAQGIVDYMARTHDQNGVTFKAYNVGLVASAATYVFLNAQDRYTNPQGAFLFHAAGLVSNGPVNAQTLRDQADKLDAYERVVRATMRRRTKLTDSETLTYVRRTVVLNSDDARRDGVVDGIASFGFPKEAQAWVIQTRKTPVPARPAPTVMQPAS